MNWFTKREDTIAALATPAGAGAIGVIRVSGSNALAVCQPLFRKPLSEIPSQKASLLKLYDPENGLLDEVLLLIFREPHSYTRETVVEISCHGSSYILQRVLECLFDAGARAAEPGEFTMRAYLNGAMDLSQAEAVADLIAARSRSAQQLALSQLKGGYSKTLKQLRDQLLEFAALTELELDFSEEDVEFADRSQILELCNRIFFTLDTMIRGFSSGNALKTGIATVIAGKPNAGKSTILNALLQENKAIVSHIPGTTRDVIEDHLFAGGYEFRLMDTAGLRIAENVIEAEGIRRSLERLETAEILLYVYDQQTETLPAVIQAVEALNIPGEPAIFLIANKQETDSEAALTNISQRLQQDITELSQPDWNLLATKAIDGYGIQTLQQELVRIAAEGFAWHSGDLLVSNRRHAEALLAARHCITEVVQGIQQKISGELISLDLRMAIYHIGSITGEISPDEVLGAIFSRFCIGK